MDRVGLALGRPWEDDLGMLALYRRDGAQLSLETVGSLLDLTEDWAVLRVEGGLIETFDQYGRSTYNPHEVVALSAEDALKLRQATLADTVAPVGVVRDLLEWQRFVEQAYRLVRGSVGKDGAEGPLAAVEEQLLRVVPETWMDGRPQRPLARRKSEPAGPFCSSDLDASS